MELTTKGKARKSLGALIHKAFALIVSVCMVCTLTPAAAWAAGVTGEMDVTHDSGERSSAASEVHALVQDTNYVFEGGLKLPGSNYTNVNDLKNAMNSDPLTATMDESGLPDNFTVTWYVTEMEYNEAAGKWEPKKNEDGTLVQRVLDNKTYTNKQGVPTTFIDGQQVPTFQYPGQGQTADLPDIVKLDGMYEFSVFMSNDDLADDSINKTASASGNISIFQNYKPQHLGANGRPEVSVAGDIYIDGPLWDPKVPELTATDLNPSNTGVQRILNDMTDEAKKARPAEQVTEGIQLKLNYDGSSLDGNDPYTGTLDVSIPLPSNLQVTTDSTTDKPTVTDADGNPTDKVNVYRYDPEKGTVAKLEGTLDWAVDPGEPTVNGQPNYLTDKDSNKIPVVVTGVKGTGFEIGVFGVGVRLNETFKVSALAVDNNGVITPYGVITPAGEHELSVGSSHTFSAYAQVPGYVFSGFTIKINGTEFTSRAANDGITLGLNTLTLDPLKAGIDMNDKVDINAAFSPQMTGSSNTLNVQLKFESGARGSVKVQSTGSSNSSSTDSSTPASITIPSGQGALITFNPSNNPLSYVKSVECVYGAQTGPVGFQGSSLMIGAITKNTTLEITYATGSAPTSMANVAVNATIPMTEHNNQPAWFDDVPRNDNGTMPTSYTYEDFGSALTIKTSNNTDYDLVDVAVRFKEGAAQWTISEKDEWYYYNTEGAVDPRDKSPIKEPEDTSTYPTINIAKDYTYDSITIYNVVENMQVALLFKPAPGVIETSGSEGGSWSWSDPVYDTPTKSKAKAKAASFNLYSDNASTYADGDIEDNRVVTLDPGGTSQLKVWAYRGYTIGDVILNDERVTNLLTKRANAGADEYGQYDIYTLTVYRGDPSANIQGMTYGRDQTRDNVYYTSARTSTADITFNQVVMPVENFYTLSTSVTEFGNGSITPSKKVIEGGSANIEFFPDEGYKVQNIWVNNILIQSDGSNFSSASSGLAWAPGMENSHLGLSFTRVTDNVQVRVSFTSGEQQGAKQTLNISASSGAGGTISPAGNYKVYEGTSETFAIVPNTGYEVKAFTVNGQDKKSELSGSLTYTTGAISKDQDVRVTFQRVDGNNSDVFNVATKVVSGKGAIYPGGTITVGAGADVCFTVLPHYDASNPDDQWYIKDIRAKYANSASAGNGSLGVPLMGILQNDFTLLLPDIQSDTVIEVTFAKSDNGNFPGTDDPVPNPDDEKVKEFEPGDIVVEPTTEPGAVVTPSASELKPVLKNPADPSEGVEGSLNLTVTVADGYELKTPIVGKSEDGIISGGIIVTNDKDHRNVVSGQCTITEVSPGVYNVAIPGELVTQYFKMSVNTQPKKTSAAETQLWKIDVKATGNGKITPATDGVVQVENGRNQTFNFIPGDHHKLHTVYVDGQQVNVTNHTYTIYDVRKDMKVEAVFAQLEEGETAPSITKRSVTIQESSGSNHKGTYSPMGTVEVVNGSNLTISAAPVINDTETNKVTARVGGKELTRIGNSFELNNITSNLVVEITFSADVQQQYYNFTVASSGPGTTSPSGTQLVAAGTPETISFKPDTGKYLKSIVVNGRPVTPQSIPSGFSLDNRNNPGSMSINRIDENTTVDVAYCDKETDSEFYPDVTSGDTKAYHQVTTMVEGGIGGVVTPASASVVHDANFTVSIIPRSGYAIQKVMVDDGVRPIERTTSVQNGALVLSRVASNLTVFVTFQKTDITEVESYYTVLTSVTTNASLPNNGGTVSPVGATTVAGGGSYTLTMMPEPGYKVSSIAINGVTATFSGSSYTLFNITEDKTVIVTFAKLGANESGSSTMTHDIIATSSVNGAISPEGTVKVADGKNSTYTFVPNPGFQLSYVRVDGNDIEAAKINNNQYTFVDVKESHTIHAVFRKGGDTVYHTITANSSKNGTITPNGSTIVEQGAELFELTIAGFYGYAPSEIEITVGNKTEKLGDLVDVATQTATGTVSDASSGSDSVSYQWTRPTLVLSKINTDVVVSAFFTSTATGGGTGSDVPGYTPITGGVDSKPPAGGSTSITESGGSGYTENPKDWDDPNNWKDPSDKQKEKFPHVTVVPDDGSMVEKVDVTYGDGSKTVITNGGRYDYDKDGNLVDQDGDPIDSNGIKCQIDPDTGKPINPVKYPSDGLPTGKPSTASHPTALDVQQQGYFEYDAEKADKTGGVDTEVTFRLATDEEKKKIEDGTITTPEYYEVNVTYSGGGTVFPKGHIKVPAGSDSFTTLQMNPQDGFELASLTIDGKNAMDKVTGTRKVFIPADANHSVHATFSYVGSGAYHKVEAFVDGGGGAVSPDKVEVANGAGVSINFYPNEGKKIERLTVTATESGTVIYDDAFSLPTYQLNNVQSNYTVVVKYMDVPDGETSWSIPEKDRLTVTAAKGNEGGVVSPETQIVAKNSSCAVYFKPDSGYQVDYIMFNEVATVLKGNPASAIVMPQVGKENQVVAYFKPVTSSDQQFVTITPTIVGEGHATVDPKTITVQVGESTQFFVYPDKGYTIDNVTVNGWPVPADKIKPAVSENMSTSPNNAYGAYVVTIDDVQPDTSINITTSKTDKPFLDVKKHTLTVVGTNALSLSPFGEVTLPVGYVQHISFTGIAGHYLASVTATQKDDSGNTVGRPVDLFNKVENGALDYTMGEYNTVIEVEYLPVGTERPNMQNVYFAGAELDDGDGKVTAIPNGQVTIGTAQTENGTIIPLTIGEDGVLMAGSKPMDFVRGQTFKFYADAVDSDGTQLALIGATYDGADLNVQIDGKNFYNTIYNVLINSSGELRLKFRHLREDEQIVTDGSQLQVKAYVKDGLGGAITSTPIFSTGRGGSAGPFVFTPDSEYWMVEKVSVYYVDVEDLTDINSIDDVDADAIKGSDLTIDPGLYSDETYTQRGVYMNTLVEVTFCEAALFTVNWDNSQGFITPNPSVGKNLKVPKNYGAVNFVVAPYENWYVDNVTVKSGDGAHVSVASTLEQGQKYAERLNGIDANSEYSVIDIDEGKLGVVGPKTEQDTDDESDEGKQETVNDEGTTIQAAYVGRGADPDSNLDARNGKKPTSNTFARAYGFSATTEANNNEVNATFYTTQSNENGFKITSSVGGDGHGRIEPAGEINVPAGATQVFNLIPDGGYVVSGLKIDGGAPDFGSIGEGGTSYTFIDVQKDHTIEVTFAPAGSTLSSPWDRFVKTAAGLAKTGDLTGPAIGFFLLLVALGVGIMAFSIIRRRREDARRYAARR